MKPCKTLFEHAARFEQAGNIEITPLADQIAERYADIRPAIIDFDPLVKFSPGERAPNDSEDAVINAAMRRGVLVEKDLPESERHGAKKRFLAPSRWVL